MSLSPVFARNDMIHLEKFLPAQQWLGFSNHHLCPALSNYLVSVIHQCEFKTVSLSLVEQTSFIQMLNICQNKKTVSLENPVLL